VSSADGRVQIESHLNDSALDSLADDVREGLGRRFKELPPKYFYDARGSELFDAITELPEYYPTRCERGLLERHSEEIVERARPTELVELGSGSATKTRLLLDAMAAADTLERYVPVDVSPEPIERCAHELVEDYPGLEVHGLVGDFERHLDHVPDGGPRLFAFLGGTIGNLQPAERAGFLRTVREQLDDGDSFLLGTDLVKDAGTLERAYDDAAGVTAAFNRNVLRVLNRELGADFDVDSFEHVALFDREASWIEMRLRATREQRVRLPGAGMEVELAPGEEIRTEISAKFTREGVERELAWADMRAEAFFTDDMFGLTLAAPRG
jgi:L-histidine N-alpha-methyltransferase